MARKRDGLAPIEEAMSDLDGPVKKLRDATPQAVHHFTRFDQVNQLIEASEADPDRGFMARLMALCSLPRTNPGNRLRYKRVNGPYTLGMSAGINNKLPFGNFPRPPDFIHPHDDGPGGSTHGKMREVICSRSLRGSIQFSRRQGGEYGIGFEIKRQADDGLRGGDFDRAGKAGGTIGSRGARGKYRRQFLCADRFRSQPALLRSLKLFGGDLHHQAAILVLGFDRLPTRGNESAGRRIVEEDTDDRLLAGELRP